jgi:hypothetical protein
MKIYKLLINIRQGHIEVSKTGIAMFINIFKKNLESKCYIFYNIIKLIIVQIGIKVTLHKIESGGLN